MRIAQGPLIALCATAVIALWMLSGSDEDASATIQSPVTDTIEELFAVQVQTFHSQAITPELIIQGQTGASREVVLISEVSGKVLKIHAREGEYVRKDQVIAEIDPQDKLQQLEQAKSTLKQRQLEHKTNQTLVERKLQQASVLAESEAALAAAKAQLTALEIALDGTKIKAPFAGVLENRQFEIGSYLRHGDELAHIMDYNPFIITGHIAEKDLHLIRSGSQATGITLNSQVHQGKVRYVSSQSSKGSRTFTIELEINNPSERQTQGATAEIRIPLDSQQAVFISPALLDLNQNGVLGAKYVDDNLVQFAPVSLVKTESSGVWVSGLPNPANIIVIGQSFASPGEKVKPVFKKTNPTLPEQEATATQPLADNKGQ